MGSLGKDSVWAGTFWGFLNVPQLGLDSVDQMCVQLRMGSWGFTLFAADKQFMICLTFLAERIGNPFPLDFLSDPNPIIGLSVTH